MKKELRFRLTDPLNPADTESQTFGCRHTNPNICGSCYLEGMCAFVTSDHVCKKPSSSWKRYYQKLVATSSSTKEKTHD